MHHATILARFDQGMTMFNRGPLKSKTISYASSERMEEFRRIADDFMLEIFDFLPGDYLITDESDLSDFTEFGSAETSPVWNRIDKLYAIGRADVRSERLVDIFAEIQARRNLQ